MGEHTESMTAATPRDGDIAILLDQVAWNKHPEVRDSLATLARLVREVRDERDALDRERWQLTEERNNLYRRMLEQAARAEAATRKLAGVVAERERLRAVIAIAREMVRTRGTTQIKTSELLDVLGRE